MNKLALAVVLALAGAADAAPGVVLPYEPKPNLQVTQLLHDANEAAVAGDWDRVAAVVDQLLGMRNTGIADSAEIHRLAGLAAFFQHREHDAEAHFMAYLRIDLDARLDPALVPPEAVTFFDDVRARHAAELRALRPKPPRKRYFVLELLPPFGQIQNGATTKAWLFGGALGTLAIANITSYLVLRQWCSDSDKTCDPHAHAASALRTTNLVTGIALIATYALGVYDGVVEYRRQAVVPFANPVNDGGVVGILGTF